MGREKLGKMKNNYCTIADNCHECQHYKNTFREGKIAPKGLCLKIDDYPFYVSKKRTACVLFEYPGRKLSVDEIITRDEKELKNHLNFMKYLEAVSKEVKSWPVWKKNCLVWK